ncbi:hypothetical protein [Enterococcus casseliflavus]|uniref:Competence protein ComK n=1 Tax=Enterococcus casseliflavus TaxID=37734 RepID=A0AAW8UKP4_ENTCA|nr:hypothetical protein [Enterococcus casseliflavus]MDT2965306.1 hypothetical protein [Enterococcus casseliflavus]
MILPLEYYDYEQCLLIYQDSIPLVTCRSSAIIQMILSHYHHFDHRIYKETMNLILTQQPSSRQYKTPIATSEYSLFPLTNAKSHAIIWLNPTSVQNLSAGTHETIVHQFNTISFRSPIEPRSVRNNMYTSFIAHGIMKRDFTPTVVQENMSIYEYLHLPYSKEITKIIQNTSYADITGKSGNFMAYYFSIFNEHTY